MYLQTSDYKIFPFQFGTLARMLQVDPPPKAVKVTMSKRVPLVGDELKAYEEEQECIKKEEVLKASISKEKELKASHESNAKASDPMVVDASSSRKSSNGIRWPHFFAALTLAVLPDSSHLQLHSTVLNIMSLLITSSNSPKDCL